MLNSLWNLVRGIVLPTVGAALYTWFASRTEITEEDGQIIAQGFIDALNADIAASGNP